MSQADFQRLMDAADYGISKQTVSQWASGENAPDANTVLAVAQVLGAQDTEALRAAGFDPVADRIERRGTGPEPTEPIDPVIQEIMGITNLSLKFRQTMVADYLAGQEEIRRRYRSVSKMASEESGSAGSAA
jgi:transcriptional regulator with XRE-family HTH domain